MESHRVVPMKLFATWEVDRTSPNCVPRICTMTLTRLTVLKPLDSDLNCLIIAVKLQGYKRTLRSNDLQVSAVNGIIDIDLDISFTLQYPHFVKRKYNCIQLLLQRRKKYKNRPLPGGYKTLAVGTVNLTEVVQSSVDRELALYPPEDAKANADESNLNTSIGQYNQQQPLAKLYFLTCNSQPLEQEEERLHVISARKEKEVETVGDLSDEDADDDSTQEELGGSDSEPMDEGAPFSSSAAAALRRMKGGFKLMSLPPNRLTTAAKQKNLKHKFMTLLKKFKMSEELRLPESGAVTHASSKELEALFEELENLSDSGPEPEIDNVSIHSAPKPGLRPYFNSTTSSKEALPLADDVFLPQLLEQQQAGVSEESKESEDLDTTTDDVDLQELVSGSSPNRAKTHKDSTGVPSPKDKDTARNVAQSSAAVSDKKRKHQAPKHAQSDMTSERASSVLTGPHAGTCTASQSSCSVQSPAGVSAMTKLKNQSSTVVPPVTPRLLDLPPLKHAPIGEQLSQRLTQETAIGLPDTDSTWIVSAYDVHCMALIDHWRSAHSRVFLVTNAVDVRAVFSAVMNRIQKFCNTNAQAPKATPLCLIGGDRFLSFCLKCYTELFAQKTNEWQQYVRFNLVTPVNSTVSRCLASLDASFSSNAFCDTLWREWWEKTDIPVQDVSEITNRIQKYLLSAKSVMPMPIAEAMLQLRDKGVCDENSQVFVPFMVDVRVGGDECESTSTQSPSGVNIGSGPPSASSTMSPGASPRDTEYIQSAAITAITGTGSSPPSSPHIPAHHTGSGVGGSEAQDLQIEYWAGPATGAIGVTGPSAVGRGVGVTPSESGSMSSGPVGAGSTASGSKRDGPVKASLKTAFRSLVVSKLPINPSQALFSDGPPSLSLHFVREKKKDKMLTKLGMKKQEKQEIEQRSQMVDSISRLICSRKHSTTKVVIDGVEWSNVKFFQVSAQWQTHVKQFPVSLIHSDF